MTRLPSTIKMISEDVIVKLSVRVIIRLHYIWFATVDCSLFFFILLLLLLLLFFGSETQ